MGVIFNLTIRYMKKNRKRTTAAIAGIMGTMIILTAVNIFASTFLSIIKNNIISEEGSYHAVFHELTSGQCEDLKKSKKLRLCANQIECAEHPQGESFCAGIEMNKVNRRIFSATQKLAREIGMSKVPDELQITLPNRRNAEYNITYHMELLEYYGIDDLNETGVGTLINAVYWMLVLMGCVLIYNAYAISVFEKLKYLGTLGSIGASKYQKALVVYWEGILEGLIGLPLGVGIGIGLSKGIILLLQNALLYDESIRMEITPDALVKLVLTGTFMIFLACFFPARKAIKTSSMELIKQQHSITRNIQDRTDLLKTHNLLGVSGTLALKNIWVKRKSYLANALLLVVTFCLLLDGFAAMRGINGDYYPKDERERPELQLWVELYTTDIEKIHNFYQKILEMPEVTNVSLERILDLEGALLERNQIQEDLNEFEIQEPVRFADSISQIEEASTGKLFQNYWIHPFIIGLDNHSFQKYLEKSGYTYSGSKEYPVLIEDHIEIKVENETCRRSILNSSPGSDFSFLYSRYGDLSSWVTTIKNQVDEIKEGKFYLIGTTEEAPPYPYFSGMQDDINGYQERTLGIHRIYMPITSFEKLLADPDYKDTYGEHPVDTAAYNYTSYKCIPTYLKFDLKRNAEKEETSFFNRLFHNQKLALRLEQDKKAEQFIEQIASEIGLRKSSAKSMDLNLADSCLPENDTYCFNSQSIWQKNQYFHSEKFLLLILGYGIILLITALSLTNMVQNISMSMRIRKREFAVYQSMGMSSASLKKMLIIENSMYGLTGCLFGIPISMALLYEVYMEFSHSYEIVWRMPWDIFPIQFMIAVLLILIPVIHTINQMKHLNIIESIRDENT